MIASVAFRNFKALRDARVALAPFNLIIGPNGSGKTSLIEALLRLRTLSRLPPAEAAGPAPKPDAPEMTFRFSPPYEEIEARLGCRSEFTCDLLQLNVPAADARWQEVKARLAHIRSFLFDHYSMAAPVNRTDGAELSTNAANLAAVLVRWQAEEPLPSPGCRRSSAGWRPSSPGWNSGRRARAGWNSPQSSRAAGRSRQKIFRKACSTCLHCWRSRSLPSRRRSCASRNWIAACTRGCCARRAIFSTG